MFSCVTAPSCVSDSCVGLGIGTTPSTTMIGDLGECDYLVVGAGAAGLAFVDTLLSERPDCRVVVVDGHAGPGGQWVDAYDFVRLHQPSVLYGVASRPLEGPWPGLLLRGTLPWKHRADRKQLVSYYQKVIEQWMVDRDVRFFFGCHYDFAACAGYVADQHTHVFRKRDGSEGYAVRVTAKLVNGVLGECRVPSRCPLEFPVAPGLTVVTPNELVAGSGVGENTNFVVLGAGKTGCDVVAYLLGKRRVPPDDITWIVPRDVWMLRREKALGWTHFTKALLAADGDRERALDELVAKSLVVQVDPAVRPTKLRLPLIGKDELALVRKVKNVIRYGRVTEIVAGTKASGAATIKFGKGGPTVTTTHGMEAVFVHCASPGPFNGSAVSEIFASDAVLNLHQIITPPVCCSSAMLAMLETARAKGTMDVEFAKEVTGAATAQGALEVFQAYTPGSCDSLHDLMPLRQTALWLAFLDKDPKTGYKALKSNRLSLLSIPGFKLGIYEDMVGLVAKRAELGIPDRMAEMDAKLMARMEVLKGM